jgi:hypothetical protein
MHFFDFTRNGMNTAGFDAKTFVSGQGFTGELEKDAFEGKHAA